METVQDRPGPKRNLSKLNTVQDEPCPARTGSKLDPVGTGQLEELKIERLEGNFTQVPNLLLRAGGLFEDPCDLALYLILYSYSYGYGRRTAKVGQAQMVEFTGTSKNRVKRSLERLIKQGWIRVEEEFEPGQMKRKWRIYSPEERPEGGGKGKPKDPNFGPSGLANQERTSFKADPVQNAPGPGQTLSLSRMDPLTGSKANPLKEIFKTNLKNSLSRSGLETQSAEGESFQEDPQIPGALREYFSELKPARKREAEWRAFQALRLDFDPEQIAQCLGHLLQHGLTNSGEPCHSPMAFLGQAMGQVWKTVSSTRRADQDREEKMRMDVRVSREAALDEAQEEAEFRGKHDAFSRAFPSPEAQTAVIRRYHSKYPSLPQSGRALKSLVISAWWSDSQRSA